MAKYGDIVALLDWAMKQKEVRTETKSRRTKSKEDKPVDVFQLLQQKRQEAQMLEAFIKDMEKVNKKEDKPSKKWHEQINTPQLAMIMIVIIPVYMSLIQKFLH